MKIARLTETLNLPVISLDSGRNLGTCQGYIFDASKKALALQVRQKGFLSKCKIIPFEEISSIGRDAIMITSEASFVSPKKAPEISRVIEEKIQILGAEVLTEKGENIGQVQEVLLETRSGKINSILVGQGMIKNLARGPVQILTQDIKKTGGDRVIVSSSADESDHKPSKIIKSLEKAAIAAGRYSGLAKRRFSGKKAEIK